MMLTGVRGTAVIVATLVALALISGCGASSKELLSRDEFVRQAEGICAKAKKQKARGLVAALKQLAKKGTKPKAMRAFEERIVREVVLPSLAILTREMSRLAEESTEGAVGTIATAYRYALRRARQNPGSAIGGNSPIVEAGNIANTDYGLTACATF